MRACGVSRSRDRCSESPSPENDSLSIVLDFVPEIFTGVVVFIRDWIFECLWEERVDVGC